MRFIASVVLCGIAAFSAAQNDKIDALLAPFDKPGAPGYAVEVVQNGKLVYSRCSGLANLEYGIPIRSDTPFHIASISKQFTAFAILLLARERKLSLDDDIRKYLPEMHDFGKTITIRHLLHHTSGLRDQWDLCYLAGWRIEDVISTWDILKLASQQTELNFTPGAAFSYSNTGYTLLGQIVAVVSGKSLRDFCRERIFAPLGMTHTEIHDDVTSLIPGRAQSYENAGGKWQLVPLSYSNSGATSLFTTIDDFMKWDANLDSTQVGGPAVRDWLLTTEKLNNGSPNGYACGTFVFKYRGLDAVGHAGADAGFRSDCLRFPSQNLSIVLFANRPDMTPPALTRAIADILLEGQFTQPKPKPPGEERDSYHIAKENLDRYAGDFKLTNGAIISIRRQGDRLIGRMDGSTDIPLIATSRTAFRAPLVGASIEIVLPAKGPASKVILVGPNMAGERVSLHWPTPKEMTQYAGRYWSPELKVVYEIVVEEGQPIIIHPRNRHPLEIVLPDRFRCDIGQIAFERKDGRITGFKVTTGRSMNIRFDRMRPY